MVHGRVTDYKRMLVDAFDEYYDSGLYRLKYQVLDHTVDDLQKFETLSILGISPYEHFSVHIKHFY